MGTNEFLSQTILRHFVEHHPKGGGCRSKGFLKEMGDIATKAQVNRAMNALFHQGKLIRVCVGKYRFAQED